jgi:hypothetical protein
MGETRKNFSLEEAQNLLPVMESLMRTAIDCKKRIEEIEEQFKQINHSVFLRGGVRLDVVSLARVRAESDKAIQRVKDTMAEIESIGAQVKDLDIGLIDFPCAVDGTTVLLCWKFGEERITHWHGVNEGFTARKPIDDRIARAGNSKKKAN